MQILFRLSILPEIKLAAPFYLYVRSAIYLDNCRWLDWPQLFCDNPIMTAIGGDKNEIMYFQWYFIQKVYSHNHPIMDSIQSSVDQ